MKIITSTQHGYLDYLTVILFLVAPTIIGLTGMAGTIAYALAGIHLAMTLVTDFPLGVKKFINIKVEQPVTRLPPHKSRRAELSHRAFQNRSLCTHATTS